MNAKAEKRIINNMPILHDHYLIVPNKALHGIFDASAKKKTIAHNHAKSLADKTGKIIVVVRVVEIIVPEKAAEQSVQSDICPRCEGAGQYADYIGKRMCSLCGGTGKCR